MINGELLVDNFAGGGGASTGMEMATGVSVDIAINHDPKAIAMHMANHPGTKHYCTSVWEVDPVAACKGRPVGIAWFSPDCFEKGTLVLTSTGYKAIEEIQEGELVLTHKMRWKKVTATMKTERDEMVIKGYGHPGIVCSTGHPFYVRSRKRVWDKERTTRNYTYSEPEWKKAAKLDKTDCWGSPLAVEPIPIPQLDKPNKRTVTLPIDERLLWLAGRYVRDGWGGMHDTRADVVITCREKEIDLLREKLDMWKRSGKRAKDGELAWNFKPVKPPIGTGGQFRCSSRSLTKWLLEGFGHSSQDKKIPAWLMGAPMELKKAFMDGYTRSDAGMAEKIINVQTVSKELAYGLRSLAITMGYSPILYLRQGQDACIIKGKPANKKPLYGLRWKLEPNTKHTYSDQGILWAPIRKTTETGKRKTFYNISVEDDESYIAEGLIVHNCKHFSKAKGGKPKDKNIRGLAWVSLRWAALVRPRVIILENVEEFQTWGPLNRNRHPIKSKAGDTFRKFISQLKGLGYAVEYKMLTAADYGVPTTRKRFFLVARCDGKPICWPKPTHAPIGSKEVAEGLLQPYVGAYTQIDFNLPCPSIFDTAEEIRAKYGIKAVRPLADKTMERIAKGVMDSLLGGKEPFIVQVNHGGSRRNQSLHEPMPTITGKHGFGIVQPILQPADGSKAKLASAFIQKYYGGGYKGSGAKLDNPLPTITAIDHNSLCVATLIQMNNHCYGRDIQQPLPTITAGDGHFGEVRAFLAKYYGNMTTESLNEPLDTITAHDRFGLVTIHRTDYKIIDIGLRMLEPKELYGCQGFPADYIIDHDSRGNTYPRAEQVKRCGNSVCPPLAAALVRANLPELCEKAA